MNNADALNQALPSILTAIRPILDRHNLSHITVSKLEFAEATEGDSSANHSHAHIDGADESILGLASATAMSCRVLLDSNGNPMWDSKGHIITVCS